MFFTYAAIPFSKASREKGESACILSLSPSALFEPPSTSPSASGGFFSSSIGLLCGEVQQDQDKK